jgi:hypothetical protein
VTAATRRVGDHDPDVVPAEVPAERPLRVREVPDVAGRLEGGLGRVDERGGLDRLLVELARAAAATSRGCRPVTGDRPARRPCA